MKLYTDKELEQLGSSPNNLIAQKLGCSHMTVRNALYKGKGGKRKTELYLNIVAMADQFLAISKTNQNQH